VTAGETRRPDSFLETQRQPFVNSLGVEFLPVPGAAVLLGVWPVRIRDWVATGREYRGPKSFPHEGPEHPAGNVSWHDAQRFCAWLSERETETYRLPTDHEWSCAVGIGHLEDPTAEPTTKDGRLPGLYPWGNSWPPPLGAGNYQGEEWRGNASALRALRREYLHYYPVRTEADIEQIQDDTIEFITGFNDGHLFTSPVGSYMPNELGFHDLGGNVNEWCQDRFSPSDSASDRRVLRGGSFGKLHPDQLLSSRRYHGDPTRRMASHGFRVAVEM
jgi:formylglycine-generating enzyme required for sulfatase activity